jgi:hypothetical protein
MHLCTYAAGSALAATSEHGEIEGQRVKHNVSARWL